MQLNNKHDSSKNDDWEQNMMIKEAQIKKVSQELEEIQIDREEARQIAIEDFYAAHDGKMTAITF